LQGCVFVSFLFSSRAIGQSIDVNALITIDYVIAFVVYWCWMLLLRFRHHSQIHDTSNQWYHQTFHMYRSPSGVVVSEVVALSCLTTLTNTSCGFGF